MQDQQPAPLKAASQRVADALLAAGVQPEIVEFAESTRTADEAARAIGTTVERIVKSLVFSAGGKPVLALVSGINRVDVARLEAAFGGAVRRADAAMVRETTGFAIGGVPPIAHTLPMPIVLDRDLLQYDVVYAAAGTPHSVFPIAPDMLLRITGARALDIKEGV